MTSDRLISQTLPTLVGFSIVDRVSRNITGGRHSDGRNTRRPTSHRTSGRNTERAGSRNRSGSGSSGMTAIHYPANKLKTLCGLRLKGVAHSRTKADVSCKKCRSILKSMGR